MCYYQKIECITYKSAVEKETIIYATIIRNRNKTKQKKAWKWQNMKKNGKVHLLSSVITIYTNGFTHLLNDIYS